MIERFVRRRFAFAGRIASHFDVWRRGRRAAPSSRVFLRARLRLEARRHALPLRRAASALRGAAGDGLTIEETARLLEVPEDAIAEAWERLRPS